MLSGPDCLDCVIFSIVIYCRIWQFDTSFPHTHKSVLSEGKILATLLCRLNYFHITHEQVLPWNLFWQQVIIIFSKSHVAQLLQMGTQSRLPLLGECFRSIRRWILGRSMSCSTCVTVPWILLFLQMLSCSLTLHGKKKNKKTKKRNNHVNTCTSCFWEHSKLWFTVATPAKHSNYTIADRGGVFLIVVVHMQRLAI